MPKERAQKTSVLEPAEVIKDDEEEVLDGERKRPEARPVPDHIVIDETKVIDYYGNTIKFRRDEVIRDPHRIRLALENGIKTRFTVCPQCGHKLE